MRPLLDNDLVAAIKAVIAEMPTYGYRRVHAISGVEPWREAQKPNHKRVYGVMKLHDLLLDRHAGGVGRRHDRHVAELNRRWCSDGFEIGCDKGDKARVAFSLDCCDREAMSLLTTTRGISGEDVRDLMGAAAPLRQSHRLPAMTLPVKPAASPATSVSSRGRRQSKARRESERPKLSSGAALGGTWDSLTRRTNC